MSRNLQIHTFELYGDVISMQHASYGVKDITLTHIGGKRYKMDEYNIWEKVGPLYIRLGGEHGFMILKDYDNEDFQ